MKVDNVRSFLTQMSAQNSEDFIASFKGYSYRLDINASETRASHFVVCLETIQEKLYCYNQYSGILTSSNAFIFPCALSDEIIGLMIWRTRDARPVNHLLVYNTDSKTCHLIKRNWTNYICDTNVDFDKKEVLE